MAQNESPSYLSSKISTMSSMSEREKIKLSNTINIARVRANTILGNRKFEDAVSILWNNLPNHLKTITSTTTFKKGLTTQLMNESYNLKK